MPARSGTCVPGLAMVSTNTMRVAGVSASATAAADDASTRLTSNAQPLQRAQHAVGVAEQMAARDQVVARAQQRQEHGRDRGHAGREAHGAHALLERRELGLQRGGGRRALARVVEAVLQRALEHADQVFDALVAVLHRRVHRHVHAALLDAEMAVGVQQPGGRVGGRGRRRARSWSCIQGCQSEAARLCLLHAQHISPCLPCPRPRRARRLRAARRMTRP